jgi:hypothetical protein
MTEERPSVGTGGTDDAEQRYAAIALADGETVVYDRHNERAWIQSDVTAALADAC